MPNPGMVKGNYVVAIVPKTKEFFGDWVLVDTDPSSVPTLEEARQLADRESANHWGCEAMVMQIVALKEYA